MSGSTPQRVVKTVLIIAGLGLAVAAGAQQQSPAQGARTAPPAKAPAPAPAKPQTMSAASVGPTMSAAAKPVARIRDIAGNVLVSAQAGLVASKEGTLVQNGARVVAAGSGRATLEYFDGCKVVLNPAQRVLVNDQLECAQRVALLESVVLNPEALQLALAGSTELIGFAALPLAGAGVPLIAGGIALAPGTDPETPVSPN